MRAVKSVALGRPEIVNTPIPSVKGHPGFVLIKTKYIGISHCDYLFTDNEVMFQENATIGSECCGEVVDVAEEGCERFKVGDRIAGCVFISCTEVMPNAGCLAEYALVKGDAQFSVDALGDAVQEEQTAGLGIAFSTAFHGLYHTMKLPWPEAGAPGTRDAVLIYGGTTTTGLIAIQLAKLSGLKVLTTCSPKNFDLVRSLGADHVFDYKDAAVCISDMRALVGDDLKYVLDCFGASEAPRICGEVIGSNDGIHVSVSPRVPAQKDKDVAFHFTQGQKALGEPFLFMGQVTPPDAKAFEDWKTFILLCERLIREGKIKLIPAKVVGSFESVADTLDLLRAWGVHATKLVCTPS